MYLTPVGQGPESISASVKMEDEEDSSKDVAVPSISADTTLRRLWEELNKIFINSEPEPSLELKETSKFLGCSYKVIKNTTKSWRRWLEPNILFNLDKFLNTETKLSKAVVYTKDISGISDNEGLMAPKESIEIDYEKYVDVWAYGYFFCEWKGIPVILQLSNSNEWDYLAVSSSPDTFEQAKAILGVFDDYQKKNCIYRNKHVYFTGDEIKFLPIEQVHYEDVVLDKDVLNDVKLNVVFPIRNKKLLKDNGMYWKRSLLLEGYPGTGKTKLCKALSNDVNCSVVWATSKSMSCESNISFSFYLSRLINPTLLIIEDIDLFASDRDAENNPSKNGRLGELLNQLDGVENNEGLFVISTSNRWKLLDKAIVHRPSRVDVKVSFGFPKIEERINLIRMFFTKFCNEISEEAIQDLAKKTDNLTPAYIQEIAIYSKLLRLNSIEATESVGRALKVVRGLTTESQTVS